MRLAVVGGGQLGLMLGQAADPLGVRCRFLDPSPEAPAGRVGELLVGPMDDPALLERLADGADAVTFEWENLPAAAAPEGLAPPVEALAAAQDRLEEKRLCKRLGLDVAPFAPAASAAELREAAERVGLPAILKTRRLGYDGKSQARIDGPDVLADAWDALGGGELLLERVVDFERELSIVAVRGRDGATAFWPLAENIHRGGILQTSRAPAAPELQETAEAFARTLLDELDYVGVLAVELFDDGGALLVNEMAPRVHNSGHWTIEGAATSQFENHVRAVLGLPLGPTHALAPTVMVNLIGGTPPLEELLRLPHARVHLYGKAPRPGRKLGHVTLVGAPEAEVARAIALAGAASA